MKLIRFFALAFLFIGFIPLYRAQSSKENKKSWKLLARKSRSPQAEDVMSDGSEQTGNTTEPDQANIKDEVKQLAQAHKKTNNTVQDINSKVSEVDESNQEIGEKLSKVIENEKEDKKVLKKLSKTEKKLKDKVKFLASTVEQIGSDVVGVKVDGRKIREQLSSSKTKSPALDRVLTSFKREIADIKSRLEMNPTVFKITRNQRVLAEALESIDRELTIFERKLGHIDESSDEMRGRLTNEELHRKTLNGALHTLTSAVRKIRIDIDKLENPLSEINTKRTGAIRAMKSDINILMKNNKKLNHDTSKTRTELNNLLKDLLMVQQKSQESKTSITALVESNRNLRQDFGELKQDQTHMMSKIQTLATVYRSVLTALHNMEVKQIQVMHKMKQYEVALHKLSVDFLGKKMESGSGSNKVPTISANLTSYYNLLVSQKNLYSQLLGLRSDVNKLKLAHGLETTTPAPEDEEDEDDPQEEKGNGTEGKLNLATRLKGIHRLNSKLTEQKNKKKGEKENLKLNNKKEKEKEEKVSKDDKLLGD